LHPVWVSCPDTPAKSYIQASTKLNVWPAFTAPADEKRQMPVRNSGKNLIEFLND